MTTREKALKSIHDRLFSDASLVALVGGRLEYTRGPVTSEWPLVQWFEVAHTSGYLVDFDSVTVQFSAWALDPYGALAIIENIKALFSRWKGDGSEIEINWSSLIDAGALPTEDQKLKGQFLRYTIRYRGENIGG